MIAALLVMSNPPSYASDKKASMDSVVTEAIGGYLEDNQLNVRENIKKEIEQLAYTFTAIEDDFAKITPEIRKLDKSKVLKEPRSKDWQGLHNVCHPHWLIPLV